MRTQNLILCIGVILLVVGCSMQASRNISSQSQINKANSFHSDVCGFAAKNGVGNTFRFVGSC